MAKLNQLVPNFKLLSTKGEEVELWRYRQRKNLALIVAKNPTDERFEPFVSHLSQAYHEFGENNTEVLVVISHHADDFSKWSDTEFPVLLDQRAHVSQTYLNGAGGETENYGVFVIDRFGELIRSWRTAQAGDLPSVQEILDALHLIELQCPECGVSDWPV